MAPGDVEEDQFRADALAFLEATLPKKGVRTDSTSNGVTRARAYQACLAEAGVAGITWPIQYGGRGLPGFFQRIFDTAARGFQLPPRSLEIGLGMCGPTILAHGTEPVKQAYLQKLWRGEIIACQLFSEPSNGSDLAGVQTRAILDGDEWILNGQKVWTSGAHYSDIGEIICRTDPDLPKHQGLSAFVVNMKAPGVEVRPLRQMTGGASFNEVFFTDVRVPADHLLGDVNSGWTVALTTLMNERAAIGGGGAAGGSGASNRLLDLMRHLGATTNPLIRQEYANLYINLQVARWNSERAMSKIRAGQLPGPELSIGKLSLTENMRRTAELAAHVLGPRITADSGEWGTYGWSQFVLGVPGMRVAGGTDEVMRNILAERVLGLPKEPSGKS